MPRNLQKILVDLKHQPTIGWFNQSGRFFAPSAKIFVLVKEVHPQHLKKSQKEKNGMKKSWVFVVNYYHVM